MKERNYNYRLIRKEISNILKEELDFEIITDKIMEVIARIYKESFK